MDTKHKNSIKRSALLGALRASCEHPTAEALYEQLKPDYPDLSLGTVYRNLSVFCDEGLAVTVGKVQGKERFDGRTDLHPHFVCRCCGRVLDISVFLPVSDYFRIIRQKQGYSPEGYSLLFSGVCDSCGN